jgi:hypothetical protein
MFIVQTCKITQTCNLKSKRMYIIYYSIHSFTHSPREYFFVRGKYFCSPTSCIFKFTVDTVNIINIIQIYMQTTHNIEQKIAQRIYRKQ